jgi:hypothetical protein
MRHIIWEGKMYYAAVYTCVLVVAGILIFASSFGRMLPAGVKFVPLLSIALIWAHTFFSSFGNGSNIPGTILIILFYFFTFVIVAPLSLGILFFAVLDRERSLPPEVIGDPSRKDKVCVIYHPGMSDFTITGIRTFAFKLAEKGFSTTIATANKALAVIFKNYKALVFASPVYGGVVRPPLIRFIERNNLSGLACFILLTGSVKETAVPDMQKAAQIVTASKGSVTGAIKVTTKESEQELRKVLENFGSEIASIQ